MEANHPLRILIVEDVSSDAELAEQELLNSGFQFTSVKVDTEEAFRKALEEFQPHLIISDYAMPEFDGMEALRLALEHDARLPFIVLTGSMNEETAVDCMKAGATDYVIKDRLARLPFAVREALGKKKNLLEKEAAEEALQASNDKMKTISQQLLQAEKLATMGELAASIAHELNNPLATISLRLESLIGQTPEDDPRLRELKIIGQEAERMAKLVATLLQTSRRSQPQISTVNICEEIDNTLELIHFHLHKYNVKVVREFAPGVPNIHADRQQLRQLFLNLFTNASDAMPDGGTLTILTYVQEAESETTSNLQPATRNRFVVIEIADTGVGIPPEILPKIIETFFTTKPEGKGTGLGMAICRRIVKDHKGTFEITSSCEIPKGTTIRIAFPTSLTSAISGSLREEKLDE